MGWSLLVKDPGIHLSESEVRRLKVVSTKVVVEIMREENVTYRQLAEWESLDLLPTSPVNKPGTSMLWAWCQLWVCGFGMKCSTDCTAWSSEWPEKQGQKEHLWGIPLSTVSKPLLSSFCKWWNRPRGMNKLVWSRVRTRLYFLLYPSQNILDDTVPLLVDLKSIAL